MGRSKPKGFSVPESTAPPVTETFEIGVRFEGSEVTVAVTYPTGKGMQAVRALYGLNAYIPGILEGLAESGDPSVLEVMPQLLSDDEGKE